MKTPLLLYIIFLILVCCKTEEDVGPASQPTFLRYYGSSYNHTAVLAIEADNGYTLLSNIDISTSSLGGKFMNKIRLIHTDKDGNVEWNEVYPSFDVEPFAKDSTGGYKASSFIPVNDGYLIVGQRIKRNQDTTFLHLIHVGNTGEIIKEMSIKPENGKSLTGVAVDVDTQGDYYVLANISNGTPDIYFAKIKKDEVVNPDMTVSTDWDYSSGEGFNTLVNQLFVDSAGSRLTWAGTENLNTGDQNLRIFVANENQSPFNPSPYGTANQKEKAYDFCKSTQGYAIVGSIQGTGDEDILVTRFTQSGTFLGQAQFDFNGLNDQALSITQTKDNGFILLSTGETGTDLETGNPIQYRQVGNGGKDLYLVKLSATGAKVWDANFGGSNDEVAASVRQTSDESYLIFGTTSFGDLTKLLLVKVNSKGQLL